MMTFHESYGHLPERTLRLIKKFNVSQADFDGLLYIAGYEFGDADIDFETIDCLIVDNSPNGYYQPRYF